MFEKYLISTLIFCVHYFLSVEQSIAQHVVLSGRLRLINFAERMNQIPDPLLQLRDRLEPVASRINHLIDTHLHWSH